MNAAEMHEGRLSLCAKVLNYLQAAYNVDYTIVRAAKKLESYKQAPRVTVALYVRSLYLKHHDADQSTNGDGASRCLSKT